MSERPWCGMCGGSCMRMEEHFGEVLDRETSCDECGIDLHQSETHQPSGGCSVFCLECWNNRASKAEGVEAGGEQVRSEAEPVPSPATQTKGEG